MKTKKNPALFYGIIILAGALLCVRARYGVDFTDESYYFAEAARFFQGDRPFREEWFTTQMIGILLLPLYCVHHLMTGGAEGILLSARLLYVMFSVCVSALVFRTLTQRDQMERIPALLFSLFFLLYARANIPTFSYYNIGTATFLIFLLWRRETGVLYRIGGGISFAVSVLCMPYLVLYFVVMEGRNVLRCIKGKREWKEEAAFLAGIGLSAAVFLLFVVQSGSIGDVFRNLPEILKDPEHQGSMAGSLFSFVDFMVRVFYRYLFLPMAAETAGILYYIWKRRESQRLLRFLRGAAYALFFVQAVYVRTFFEGGIIIVLFLLAVQLALLNGNKSSALWKKYAAPGLLYGIIWMFGSNVGQRVFNMGCLIACIWAVQVIWTDAGTDKKEWRRLLKLGSVVLTLGVLALIRFCDIYRDGTVDNLTVRLERGAAKGLYTTKQRAAEYEDVLSGLCAYARDGMTFAVQGTNPWLYLEADARCGAYAVWSVDFTDPRNEIYYERYPDKVPDVIFLLNPDYGTYEGWRFSSHGSNTEGLGVSDPEGYLEELVVRENYQKEETSCGVFYIRQ